MNDALAKNDIGPVFDADNHYWETSDAFMRYRSPKYKDRGLRLVEHEGQVRYFMGEEIWPMLPGPGELHLRPIPGSLFDFFGGRVSAESTAGAFSQSPKDHPEYYNRDARLRAMDTQGLEACWLFPSHGVCIEGPMQAKDVEASLDIMTAFNRWIDDDWGFAHKNRIFGVPMLSLTDPDLALREFEWVVERGARVVTMRHGPAFTRDGFRSPADPMFDTFWARVQEAGVTMAFHAGQEESYRQVTLAKANAWGLKDDTKKKFDPVGRAPNGYYDTKDFSPQLITWLMKKQLIHDHAGLIIAQGLFRRFPRLRVAYIEFGGTWVGSLLHELQMMHGQYPDMFHKNPIDQFHENCWVAPFVEEEVGEMARHMPTERILFGSDWPHGEGIAVPRDFLASLEGFSDADVRKIMVENARELTYA